MPVLRGHKRGVDTPTLLPGIVQEALDALPIPKRMRWGAGTAEFVRPVHWLLMLYGREVVPATMLGTSAGGTTHGHRFMAPKPIRITTPAGYERTLLTRGKVLAASPSGANASAQRSMPPRRHWPAGH